MLIKVVIIVEEHESVENSTKSASNNWTKPEDPMIREASLDNWNSEASRRVDAGACDNDNEIFFAKNNFLTGDRDEEEMSHGNSETYE